jgi:hypothetical protein
MKTKRKADRVNLVKKPPPPPPPVAKKKVEKKPHPHTSKVVGRTVWAGVYCRRPACRAGFVMLLPVIDGELGQRPPFCSDACQRATNTALRGPLAAARRRADTLAAAGKVLAVRQPALTPTLPDHIVVAGWCAHHPCGQVFTQVTPLWSAPGVVARIPRFCSAACRRRERDQAEARSRAVMAARRLCLACWSSPRSGGFDICAECFEVLRESCRRKRRRSEEAARRAAPLRSETEGRTMVAYPCGMCRFWHIGGATENWKSKRVRFLVSVFVATASAGEVRRLVEVWDPKNMDLNQRLDGHAGLAALRDRLETGLEEIRS